MEDLFEETGQQAGAQQASQQPVAQQVQATPSASVAPAPQPATQQTQQVTPPNTWWGDDAVIIRLDDILSYINATDGISDLLLSWWEYICFREHGDLVKQTNYGKLNYATMRQCLIDSYQWDVSRFEAFLKMKDEDYAYISKEWIPYRVNSYMRLGQLAIVMRKINGKAMKLDDIMFEDTAQAIRDNILVRKKGLYLVTWPTWSWKSTSLVAMIELMNQQRQEHIITMEDPIEFIFEPKQCSISQRNIWIDTNDFKNALRAAMREDPDIIFVWEIRDRETAEAALNMAETWHFVFSTLHTASAAATVNRYISFFPPEIQESVCDRLATALAWIQSQMLVHKVWGWRVWVYEFLVNNTAVRNNIKKREIPQINNTIETSSSLGMISMRWYAERLLEMWMVTQESVNFIFAESGW